MNVGSPRNNQCTHNTRQGLIQWGGQRGHAPPPAGAKCPRFWSKCPSNLDKMPPFAPKCPTNLGKMPSICPPGKVSNIVLTLRVFHLNANWAAQSALVMCPLISLAPPPSSDFLDQPLHQVSPALMMVVL